MMVGGYPIYAFVDEPSPGSDAVVAPTTAATANELIETMAPKGRRIRVGGDYAYVDADGFVDLEGVASRAVDAGVSLRTEAVEALRAESVETAQATAAAVPSSEEEEDSDDVIAPGTAARIEGVMKVS